MNTSDNFSILRPEFDLSVQNFFEAIQGQLSETLVEQLASQGFRETADKTACFFHDSTNCIEYCRKDFHKGLVKGLNMDSGAILQRMDEKTNAACVADGTGGGKLPSAFAAHLFCQILIEKLRSVRPSFHSDAVENKTIVSRLFQEIANEAKSVLKVWPEEVLGSATLGFVDCKPLGARRYQVLAGALGDIVIYHYSSSKKTSAQINTIARCMDKHGQPDKTDTGGMLNLRGEFYALENSSAEVLEIDEDDLLLLASDGLHDNLNPKEAEEILAFLINCPFFDQPMDTLVGYKFDWPELPTLDQLRQFVQENSGELESSQPAEPATAVKRVNAYLKLIVHAHCVHDKKVFTLKVKLDTFSTDQLVERRQVLDEGAKLGPYPKTVQGCKLDDIMLVCINPSTK